MIGYLKGAVTHLFADYCFIDVQGVGYRVFVSAATREKLPLGAHTFLYTYFQVREDASLLYGFITQEEYDLFLHLISVSGIGPKVALGILSAIQPQAFSIAIGQKNLNALTKLPGVGKKTAERMIVELKDKLGAWGSDSEEESIAVANLPVSNMVHEATQALLGLGYSQAEILPVLKKLADQAQSVEGLIKSVLKAFGGRQ